MQPRAMMITATTRQRSLASDSLALLLPLLLLLLLCPALLSSARSFTCREPDRTLMSFCADSVPYLIASDIDESTASYLAKEQHDKSCTFYAYEPYACRKFFPECRNTSVLIPQTNQATGVTSWVDSGNYTSVEIKICKFVCQQGWNDECKRYFSQAQLELECSLPDYYADGTPPTCAADGFLDTSVDKSLYWKIGLGVGLGLIACVALFFLARRHLRDKWTPEQMAAYDDAKADKLRAAKLKEKAKAAAKAKKEQQEREKKEAKQRKKYASDPAVAAAAAQGDPATNGSAPPAAGAADRADTSGGEVFSDLELGSPSPPAATTAAAAATSADGTGAPRSGLHKSQKHKSHHAADPKHTHHHTHGQGEHEMMMMSPAARKNEAYAAKNAKVAAASHSHAAVPEEEAQGSKPKKSHKSSSKHRDKHVHRSEQKSAEPHAIAVPPEDGHAPIPSAPPAPSASPAATSADAASLEPAAVRIHFADADQPPQPQPQPQQQPPQQQQQQQPDPQDVDSWKSGLPTRVAPPE